MKTLGIIGGNGKWGQNFVKLSEKLQYKTLIGDRDNWKDLIQSGKCDGIIIATPPQHHVEQAIEALKCKLPVMIEKPLAWEISDAIRLKEYEEEAPILVNNLHLFSPAFTYICNHVKPENVFQITSSGTNRNRIINYLEYSVPIDYAFHDLSMGFYLMNNPDYVEIEQITQRPNGLGEEWDFTFAYSSFVKHKVKVSNVATSKVRYFEVITNNGDIFSYDDVKNNKLFVNNSPHEMVENVSTLENSIKNFLMSIDGYTDNRFGLDLSLKILNILEECKNLVKG